MKFQIREKLTVGGYFDVNSGTKSTLSGLLTKNKNKENSICQKYTKALSSRPKTNTYIILNLGLYKSI